MEHKELALLERVFAKPTPSTIFFYLTFARQYFDEAFAEYLIDLAIGDLEREGEAATRENIDESIQTLIEAFMTFPEDLVTFYENYLKETGNKPPRAHRIAS